MYPGEAGCGLPFVGWRRMDVADKHAACTWAEGVRRLVEEDFAGAKRSTLVMDNWSTHCGASLYKAFEPEVARRLLDRLEFVYTPKHGSWLNMSECEFSVLSRQCLNRRLPDIDRVRSEVNAWVEVRNGVGNTTHWRFTTEDARIKLRSLLDLSGFGLAVGTALSEQASDRLSGGPYAATDRSSVNSCSWALYLVSILGPWQAWEFKFFAFRA